MPSGTYTYTLYTISGDGNGTFTVTGSFEITIYDPDDDLGVGDDQPVSETGSAPIIQSLGPGAPSWWNIGDTFYFGGARGMEANSTTADDFLVPKVAGVWQTKYALYSLPDASVPLVVGQTYTRSGPATNVLTEVAPCFVAGSLIKTISGEIPVERLTKGDMVYTLDNGYLPVQWVGRKTVRVTKDTAPIRFAAGTMGNNRPLLVSPNHRMLLRSPQADLLFGDSEVLIAAKFLTNMRGVSQIWPDEVTYVHVLFDSHQVICANGALSESFHPGLEALGALETETRQEVLDIFPQLQNEDHDEFPLARTCLRSFEVPALMNATH